MKRKFMIFCFLIIGITLGLATPLSSALESESTEIETLATAEATISEDHPWGMMTLLTPRNIYGTLKVTGTDPVSISEKTYLDGTPGGTPLTGVRNEDEDYPLNLGMIGAGGIVQDPWNAAQWIRLDNNTEIIGDAMYNFTFEIDRLGVLGQFEQEFYLDMVSNAKWYELDLYISTPGVYVIVYSAESTMNNYDIIKPDGNQTQTYTITTPDVTPNGQKNNKQILFIAPETGNYHMYFTCNTHYITMELQRKSTISNIKAGDRINYKEQDNPGVEDMYKSSMLPVHVYTFDVVAGEALYYNYLTIWGQPSVRIVIYDDTTNTWQTMTPSSGVNNVLLMPQITGKAYLIVWHSNHWVWNGGDIPIKQLLQYSFSLETVPSEMLTLDTKQTFGVDPGIRYKVIWMNITQDTHLILNGSIKVGSPTVTNLNSLKRVENGKQTSVGPVATLDTDQRQYYLKPGMYYVYIQHSLTKYEFEYFDIQTHVMDVDSIAVKRLSVLDDTPIQQSSATLTEHQYYYEEPNLGANEILEPTLHEFSYDDYWDVDVNVSIYGGENEHLTNPAINLNDFHVWIYNGTEYIRIYANSTPTDLYNNGSSEYALIGCEYMFDRVNIKLATPLSASPSADYNWSYYRFGSGWTNLDDVTHWEDTTFIPNTTLGNTGHISWEANQIWDNQNDRTTDPVVGVSVANPMYWIRLETSAADVDSIPVLAGGPNQISLLNYTAFRATIGVEIDQISPFDGKTPVQRYASNTGVMNIFGSYGEATYKFTTSTFYLGTGENIISIWPYAVEYQNSSDQTWHQYNGNIYLRSFIEENRDMYKSLSYGVSSSVNMSVDVDDVNWTTYENFGLMNSYNLSRYPNGAIIKVQAAQQYDWYHFALSSNNTDGSLMSLYFDTPWTSNTLPSILSRLNWVNTGTNNANFSDTMGIAVRDFYVKLAFTQTEIDTPVQFKLQVGNYGNPRLSMYPGYIESLGNPPTAPIGQGVSISDPIVYGPIIGGSAAIILIVGYLIYKKKKSDIDF